VEKCHLPESLNRRAYFDPVELLCRVLWSFVFFVPLFASEARGASVPSTTTLQTLANPSILGQSLSLTATVFPSIATGTVTLFDGVQILGVSRVAGGQAVLTTTLLASGTRKLKALYSGDATYLPSASTSFLQTVSALAARGFHPAMNAGSVNSPGPVAVGDFNGDGRADLAVIATLDSNISVFLGKGDGTFEAPVNFPVGTTPLSVAVGDFNGDGFADLVVANRDSNNVSVLLGKGNGTFQPATNYQVGSGPDSVQVADFNGDGRSDLAVANTNSNNVSVLLGNGDGTFQTAATYAVGLSPLLIAVGDFNGDGFADLAAPNRDTNTVSVLLGKGDGTFQPAVAYSVGSVPEAVAVGDFNGDGFADLAVNNFGGDNVSVLLGNGDGTFRAAINYPVGTSPDSVVVGDFNGDGLTDLAVTNESDNNVSVLLSNGDGTFQTALNYSVGSGPVPMAVGEFNGDGRTDLVVPNFNANNVSVLLAGAVAADLNVTKVHTGNFVQGQIGATYTITVGNVGQSPTAGVVNVVDTLPNGLSATAIAGTGWNCTLSSLTCTRSDALDEGAKFPAITLTVNIANNAPASVTNTATVSGGFEVNLANDVATDVALVTAVLPPTITTSTLLALGSVGVTYSQTLSASGGSPPYNWSLASGALPNGLILSASGVITGTPIEQGSSTFVVRVTDSALVSAVQTFSLTVGAAPSVGPIVANGGVLNAASFAKDSSGLGLPVAPGSLVSIFGTFPGATAASAPSVPDPTSLGGVSVTFGGVTAPLLSTVINGSSGFINAQVPFEVLAGAQTLATVNVVVTVNGIPSQPEPVEIVPAAPGIFTIPPDGQHNAILVFVDPADNIVKIASSLASSSIGFPTAPIPRGQSGFFYATGLGAMTPAVADGDGGLGDLAIAHPANATPIVLVGGVTASVQFAGQAPGFPGVNQINIIVPNNAPIGDAVSLQVQTADGDIISTLGATVAIR
jgi:uncharacterized protein (TIGR03437 family)